MRVPESIISGTGSHLKRIPHTLPCHVMSVRVCGSLSQVVSGRWHLVTNVLSERRPHAAV